MRAIGFSGSNSPRSSLDKIKKRAATTVTGRITKHFFYEHFVSVDLAPFKADLFKVPTVGPNILSGVFNRVETASDSWWSDLQMDSVLRGSSRFTVNNCGDGVGVIGWNNLFGST